MKKIFEFCLLIHCLTSPAADNAYQYKYNLSALEDAVYNIVYTIKDELSSSVILGKELQVEFIKKNGATFILLKEKFNEKYQQTAKVKIKVSGDGFVNIVNENELTKLYSFDVVISLMHCLVEFPSYPIRPAQSWFAKGFSSVKRLEIEDIAKHTIFTFSASSVLPGNVNIDSFFQRMKSTAKENVSPNLFKSVLSYQFDSSKGIVVHSTRKCFIQENTLGSSQLRSMVITCKLINDK